MEEEQNQDQEEQLEVVEEQPKKNIIPTRLGSLIILLAAIIAAVAVQWYAGYHIPPEGADVSGIVEQMQGGEGNVIQEYFVVVDKKFPAGYEIKGGLVYSNDKLIEGADPLTFEFISGDLSKDINHLYLDNSILPYVDSKTFKHIGGSYYRDKNKVYYTCIQNCVISINGADPETFQDISFLVDGSMDTSGHSIARDRKNVYYQNTIVEGADSATFVLLGGKFAKDKSKIYYIAGYSVGYNIFSEADFATFEYLGNEKSSSVSYSKDKNNVYRNSGIPVIIPGADSATFRVIGGKYAVDKNTLYSQGRSISHPDYVNLPTLEYFDDSYCYFKDKNNAYYYLRNIISEADSASFEYLGSYYPGYGSYGNTVYYAKDKNHVYKDGAVLENEDPFMFQIPEPEMKGQACLATGTKILMSDGNYKNIEDIQVGDLVTSYNIETKEYKTSKVDKVIKRKDPLVIINNTLRAAPDEPVYLADGTIKEAVDIEIGDYLVNEKGEQVKVNTVEQNPELVDTYDFTLENGSNFFADGYLVRTPDL